jgi:hypothetical protein
MFKKLLFITLGLFSISASAEMNEQQKKAIGALYDGYATVAGAWYLNSKCKVLSESESKKFDWYSAQFTKIIASLKNDTMIKSIQKSAKSVAENEKYEDCGNEARKIVFGGLLLSENVVQKLTKSKYDENSTFKEYQINRYSQVSKNVASASECGYLKGSMKAEVDSVLESVGGKLLNLYPEESGVLSGHGSASSFPCGEKLKSQYIVSLGELRKLEFELSQSANK